MMSNLITNYLIKKETESLPVFFFTFGLFRDSVKSTKEFLKTLFFKPYWIILHNFYELNSFLNNPYMETAVTAYSLYWNDHRQSIYNLNERMNKMFIQCSLLHGIN